MKRQFKKKNANSNMYDFSKKLETKKSVCHQQIVAKERKVSERLVEANQQKIS